MRWSSPKTQSRNHREPHCCVVSIVAIAATNLHDEPRFFSVSVRPTTTVSPLSSSSCFPPQSFTTVAVVKPPFYLLPPFALHPHHHGTTRGCSPPVESAIAVTSIASPSSFAVFPFPFLLSLSTSSPFCITVAIAPLSSSPSSQTAAVSSVIAGTTAIPPWWYPPLNFAHNPLISLLLPSSFSFHDFCFYFPSPSREISALSPLWSQTRRREEGG